MGGGEAARRRRRAGALAVPPPGDPELRRLVTEGSQVFCGDRRKGVVLLRLAARKGYLPAFFVMARLAEQCGDDPIVIDALFTLLSHEDAPRQLPPQLLDGCALQLAAVLRDPRHESELKACRAGGLATLSESWPVLQLEEEHANFEEAVGESGGATQNAVEEKRPEDIARLPAKLRERLQQRGILTGEDVRRAEVAEEEVAAEAGAGAATTGGDGAECSDGGEPDAPSAGGAEADPPHCLTRWTENGATWELVARVPGLASLAEGRLSISEAEVRLEGPGGELLVHEAVPPAADGLRAEARWSRRRRELSVWAPHCCFAGPDDAAGDALSTAAVGASTTVAGHAAPSGVLREDQEAVRANEGSDPPDLPAVVDELD